MSETKLVGSLEELLKALENASNTLNPTLELSFKNETDFDVSNLNWGWQYDNNTGELSVGNTVYKHEIFKKNYPTAHCVKKAMCNFKANGKSYTHTFKDAPTGQCIARAALRFYTPTNSHELKIEEVIIDEKNYKLIEY